MFQVFTQPSSGTAIKLKNKTILFLQNNIMPVSDDSYMQRPKHVALFAGKRYFLKM